MSFFQQIFLIKKLKLNPTKLVILVFLCIIGVIVRYSWPLGYHYINKKLHPDLTKSVIKTSAK